jgi:3-phosphoshikimate 1-carboxyvinyltransferase
MALPLCREKSVVEVINLKSRPYIEMTLDLLKQFGIVVDYDNELTVFQIDGNQQYTPRSYTIEGDWSGAAFLLVAGAIGGSIEVKGLKADSFQADKAILDGLQWAGAMVEINDEAVLVKKGDLTAFEFDATDCPDLVPPLTALAANCRGKSVIHGIGRLKHKESDRAAALLLNFPGFP